MFYENVIRDGRGENFPNIEDVYDMDTENLVLVKENIEEKFNFNEEVLLVSDGDDDIDLNFCSVTSIEISVFKEKRLKKLYKFVIAELKERNYFEEVLNFFLDKNSFEKITQDLFSEKYNFSPEIKEADYLNKKDELFPDENNLRATEEIKDFIFNPVTVKSTKNDIRSLLLKTKVDDGFKLLVGQPSIVRNIKTVNPDKKIIFEGNKETKSLVSKNKRDTPVIVENVIKNTKINGPIKINYNINLSINVKSKKKKKLKKINQEENNIRDRSKSNLEMRRNYVVPNIKSFVPSNKNNNFGNNNIQTVQTVTKEARITNHAKKEENFNSNLNNLNNLQNLNNLNRLSIGKASFVYNTRIDIEVKDKNSENKLSINLENNGSTNCINIENQKINIEVKEEQKDIVKKEINKQEIPIEEKINNNLKIEKIDTNINSNLKNLNLGKINEFSIIPSNEINFSINNKEILPNIININKIKENFVEDENFEELNLNNDRTIEREISSSIISTPIESQTRSTINPTSYQNNSKRIPSFSTIKSSLRQSCQEIDEESSYSQGDEGEDDEEQRDKMFYTPIENLVSEPKKEKYEKVDFESLKNLISVGDVKLFTQENTQNTENTQNKYKEFTQNTQSRENLENTNSPTHPNSNKAKISSDLSNSKNAVTNKNKNNSTNENFSKKETLQLNQFNKTANSGHHFPKIAPNNQRTFATGLNFYPNTNTNSNFNINKDRKKSALAQLKERSKSSKLALFKHIKGSPKMIKNENENFQNIPDYSHLYKNFIEIFNGYFLSSYTSARQFDSAAAMSSLYTAFKGLDSYEMTQTGQIAKFERLNSNILEAEAEVIKNRLKQVSDKLLTDQDNLVGERYYVFKKILELQKKDYGRRKDTKILAEDGEELEEMTSTNKMYFRVVLYRPEIYDIMCYTLGLREEWSELPHGMLLGQSWNLLWTYSVPNIDMTKIFSFQKVNHLINNRVFSRKDLLKKSLDRIRKMNQKLSRTFDIMPTTFILSKDYVDFVDEFTRSKNSGINPAHNLWIVKPVGKSRGRGIFIINDISEVPVAESFLVQRYLINPLLIDGYKFDMRIYVLVTSVNPLEAFIYKDGFARISNMPFSLSNNSRLVHLTNASVQNKLSYGKRNQNYEKMYGGSKISLEMLKNKLMYKGVNFDNVIWNQVKEIVLKSLVAGQHETPYSPATFELFGYDVIIDTNLECWLLEINSSPSLERSNVLDDQVKLQLVEDVLNIVDPVNFDRKALLEVLERRLNINNAQSNKVYLYSPTIQLNLDLNQIFMGKVPRAYGEMPKNPGNFERLAPSEESNKLIKLTGGQKMFSNKTIKV